MYEVVIPTACCEHDSLLLIHHPFCLASWCLSILALKKFDPFPSLRSLRSLR